MQQSFVNFWLLVKHKFQTTFIMNKTENSGDCPFYWDLWCPQTLWYLLQTSHKQQGRENQNWKCHRPIWRCPDFSAKTQTEVVRARARHTTTWTGQDCPTGQSIRRETERQTGNNGKKISEWTGLEWNIILQKAENREEWKMLVVISPLVPQWSARLQDRCRWRWWWLYQWASHGIQALTSSIRRNKAVQAVSIVLLRNVWSVWNSLGPPHTELTFSWWSKFR